MRKRPLALLCLVFLITKGFLVFICGGDVTIPTDSIFSEMSSGDAKSQVQIQGRIYKKEHTSKNQILYLKDNFITDNETSYYESRILIYDSSFQELPIGKTIQLTGTIQKFERARNPGNFDRSMYYAKQNIYGCVLRAQIHKVWGEKNQIAEGLFQLRQGWKEIFSRNLSGEQGPVLSAMILGLKGDMSEEIKDLYQKNGISHALSISGLHISFIGLGIYGIFRKMGFGYLPAGILATVLLSGYSFMIGFSVSVLRAYVMLLFRVGADVTGRVYDILTALLVSAAVTVSVQPLYLLDASFWLSYGAVIGILFVVPMFHKCLPESWFRVRGLRTFLNAGVVSLAVQLFLFPIVLWYYFEISVYSFLLNVMVVPMMSWVLGLGMFGSVAYVIWSPLGALLLSLADGMLKAVARAGEWFLELPGARVVLGRPEWWEVLLYYVVFCFVLLYARLRHGKKRVWMCVMLGLCMAFSVCLFVPFPSGKLQITMLDVGQGDCIFIRGPKGTTYLIDGGSSDVSEVGKYRIEQFLKSQGVGSLDYVFVSHGDADHCSGIKEMLLRQHYGVRIRSLVLPTNYGQSNELRELASVAQQHKVAVRVIDAGMTLREEDMTITCLQPAKGKAKHLSDNAGSMILYVDFRDFEMLCTGDVEGEGERMLMENPGLQSCDVLKVAHHGSRNSGSEAFLRRVRPRISLISAGADNSYGHPHKETIERLKEVGSFVIQTTEYGAIQLETDGDLIDIFPSFI